MRPCGECGIERDLGCRAGVDNAEPVLARMELHHRAPEDDVGERDLEPARRGGEGGGYLVRRRPPLAANDDRHWATGAAPGETPVVHADRGLHARRAPAHYPLTAGALPRVEPRLGPGQPPAARRTGRG